MGDLEKTIQSCRVILDEVTRLYRTGAADINVDALRAVAETALQRYDLCMVFDPKTLAYDIVQMPPEAAE